MFGASGQEDYLRPESSSGQQDSVLQFTTNRSQPVEAGRSLGRSTSIGNLDDASSLPNLTVKQLDKSSLAQQLTQKVRRLQKQLLEQQQERRSQIEMIKKHVTLLESEMLFMQKENTKLTQTVLSLQEYNLQLLKVFSEKHLSNKENIVQRAECIQIIPDYGNQQPERKTHRKKSQRTSQLRTKRSKSKRDSHTPRWSSVQMNHLKEKIRGLDRNIQRSRDKLLSVSKRVL